MKHRLKQKLNIRCKLVLIIEYCIIYFYNFIIEICNNFEARIQNTISRLLWEANSMVSMFLQPHLLLPERQEQNSLPRKKVKKLNFQSAFRGFYKTKDIQAFIFPKCLNYEFVKATTLTYEF